MKKIIFLLLLFFGLYFIPNAYASDNSFVSIVNPIRGSDYWDIKDQTPITAVLGQVQILEKYNLTATWLLRFDALDDKNTIDLLKKKTEFEKGLFLEVTPTWTTAANVKYHQSDSWHSAGSAFLTGYERFERVKLIDASFEKFKSIFGNYPTSVGAWWIDSYSLSYMKSKYNISSALIVSDQYSTDNYQIWGQYFSTPYYPAKNNSLHPAQNLQNKLDIVISQWAPRDPVNSYGNGVNESTYSMQANDYLDFHNLDTKYFSKLLDLYTNQPLNKFSQVVVGLENSYSWKKYSAEYDNQMKTIFDKISLNQISAVTLSNFTIWYKNTFPDLSPEQIIVASDPLETSKKAVWFMDPYYRAGWFFNADGSIFRDIRQYIDGDTEICSQSRCDAVNFAVSATRVLDEVSFGHKWIIDEGKISNFKVMKNGDKYVISYLNQSLNNRVIEFLPRDISVNNKVLSIDTTILNALKIDNSDQKKINEFKIGMFEWNIGNVLTDVAKFVIFLTLFCLVPGFVFTNKIYGSEIFLKRFFLAAVVGLVSITVLFYVTSLLNLRLILPLYIAFMLIVFIKLKILSTFKFNKLKLSKLSLISNLIILSGTFFLIIPTFKNGLVFPFGLGLWGPNTHDGIWHISLINQLIKSVPPQNPIFAGAILKNYHFFYDLLLASTAYFTNISVINLIFRFYPILFSLLLGIGTYYLMSELFENKIGLLKTKIATIFSLYFVYMSGSFGWIVDYIKNKNLGGESAFWANQSISFNLNPPFAISILIIIAICLFFKKVNSIYGILILILLTSSLLGFKSYAAILVLSSLGVIALLNIFKKQFAYLYVLIPSAIFSIVLFVLNFQTGRQLIVFSPFWFINSMIDSPDRVGWMRLTLARIAGIETKNPFKLIVAEFISLVIFIIGNLGIRILSIFSFFKIKHITKDNTLLFLFILLTLSFLIPILFIQSGNPWNTIQFLYYGLFVAALCAGITVSTLILNFPKVISVPIVILIIILTPINSITTSSYYTGYLPHARIDALELAALQFLSKQPDGIVLTYPYDDKLKKIESEPWPLFIYDSTAYVSAFSKKRVYLEDESQNQILLTDYKKRLVDSKNFFNNSVQDRLKFLLDNKITYIYVPKIFKVRLDENIKEIIKIFDNNEVVIYKLNIQ